MLGATRDARRRVINRFVETELPAKSQPMQPLQIATRRIRFDHQRHCAGVRRDHQILAQAALESEPRHSKGAVLVIALRIYRVVAGFGYAPGHIARHAIPDLRLHCAAHRAMQQRLRVAWHHQIRHQILNIEPLHDSSVGSPPVSVSVRPRANQLSCGNLPCAIATKIPRRASEASRS